MKKMNPCNQCIVTAMCRDKCDRLTNYIKKTLVPENSVHISHRLYEFIADKLRIKEYQLVHNDTKISFEKDNIDG